MCLGAATVSDGSGSVRWSPGISRRCWRARGDELLPGAKRLILKLRELGKRVIFLSNNPTKDPRMYAEKLGKLGLSTPASEIVNTVVTMTRWLLSNHPEATVFPISEEPLKNSLSEAGIRMSENPEEIDVVIAS